MESASPTLLNNVFTGNLCAAVDASQSAPFLQANRITLTRADPACAAQAIAPVVFTGNLSGTALVPTVLNNTIERNDLTGTGVQPNAGAIALLAAAAMVQGNTIRFNTTSGPAPGGIQVIAQATPAGTAPVLIEQNLIYANTAACGAAGVAVSVLNDPASTSAAHLEVQVLNNSVADNTTNCQATTAEVSLPFGSLPGQILLANNILASSSGHPALDCATPLSAAAFHHNLLHNSAGLILSPGCPDPGTNRLADPMFLDRDASHADYHLPLASPGVDAGFNAVSPIPQHDLDNTPRRQNATDKPTAIIDLGPYEYPAPRVITPTTTMLNSSIASPEAFQPITLAAQATSAGASVTSGSITFATQARTLATVPVDATGRASFISSTLGAGSWSITAVYSGTESLASSASSAMLQTVQPATTILSFEITPSSASQAQSVSLAARVEAPLSTKAPTGLVGFYDITTIPATLLASTALDATGHTSFVLPGMSAGVHHILAAYPGTPDFAAVTLPSTDALTLTIGPSAYAIAANSPALTVETQHHAAMTLTLTSLGSFAGPVTMSCANLPPPASCTFTPATVTLAAGGKVKVNLTVETDAVPNFLSSLLPFGALSLLTLFLFKRRYAFRPIVLCLFAAALAVLPLTGCGAGQYPAHLAPGTYQLQVLSQSATTPMQITPVTLTVTP